LLSLFSSVFLYVVMSSVSYVRIPVVSYLVRQLVISLVLYFLPSCSFVLRYLVMYIALSLWSLFLR